MSDTQARKAQQRRTPAAQSHFLASPVDDTETSAEVARRLLGHITSGLVGVGERLPSERNLAESLGVSRSTVREALAALDLIGIVSVRHGSGTYLTGSVSDLLPKAVEWGLLVGRRRLVDLVDARQYLEVITAGRAAERATPADIDRLRAQLAEMEAQSESPETFVESDIAFHLLIADISDNSVITDSLSNIRSLLRVWILRSVAEEHGFPEHALAEHRAVLAAIEAHDAGSAERAMRRHMDEAADRLKASLANSVETL